MVLAARRKTVPRVPPCGTLSRVALRGIKHSGLRRYFERGDERKLHPDRVARIRQILELLDGTDVLGELSGSTYRLYPLKGDRKGLWSVRVDRTWRIVFRIEGGDACEVDLVDYH